MVRDLRGVGGDRLQYRATTSFGHSTTGPVLLRRRDPKLLRGVQCNTSKVGSACRWLRSTWDLGAGTCSNDMLRCWRARRAVVGMRRDTGVWQSCLKASAFGPRKAKHLWST